jgi:regulator of replication initiation timing
MGCPCSDKKTNANEPSNSHRKPFKSSTLTNGLLSNKYKIISPHISPEKKSEEVDSFETISELQKIVKNQQSEIARLNKSLAKSMEDNQSKDAELRDIMNKPQLSLTTSEASKEWFDSVLPSADMLLVRKESLSEDQVWGESLTIEHNSCCSPIPASRNLIDSASTSNSVTPGSSVDLEDLEIQQVAKKQLRYSQRLSLVLKSKLHEEEARARFVTWLEGGKKELKKRSIKPGYGRSVSCPDTIARRLDVIESQVIFYTFL